MSIRSSRQSTPLVTLLVSAGKSLADLLRTSLGEAREFEITADIAGYPAASTLEMRIRQMQPEVLLVDAQTDWAQARSLIGTISHSDRHTQIVAYGDGADPGVVLESLRAGACDFLQLPVDADTQRAAASRIRQKLRAAGRVEHSAGKAIVFSSMKQGAGATTLATQFAFAMRRLTGKRVLLVDMDLDSGAIGFSLKLSPSASMLDAMRMSERMDAALWSSLVCPAYGVDVLCSAGAEPVEDADWIRLQDVIESARAAYDWAVIDAPVVFHRLALLCLAQADDAVLVSTPDLASLHMGRRALNHLGRLGLRQKPFRLLLNRWRKREEMSTSDVEAIFGSPVSAFLSEDVFAVHRALARAEPLAAEGGLARQVEKLCVALSSSGDLAPIVR